MAAVLITSCKKQQAYCDEALDEMTSHTYTGLIKICNALPGDETVSGQATITSPNPGRMSVHLVSDTTSLDTVLNYDYDCTVVEQDIPIVFIRDGNGDEVGQFNSPHRIHFAFGYNNCPDRTWFEGYWK
jgi:hypothetical protein